MRFQLFAALLGGAVAFVPGRALAVPTVVAAPTRPAAQHASSNVLPIKLDLAQQSAAKSWSAAVATTAEFPNTTRNDFAAGEAARGTRSATMMWEMGYLALSAVDAAETISCLHRDVCTEGNPLFGRHPSAAKLIAGKVGLGLFHFGLINLISRRSPKAALRAAQISAGLQGGVVLLNSRLAF